MSFLLDTNVCSAVVKRPSGLFHRVVQHSGRLFISSVVLGELYAWAYRRSDPAPLIAIVESDLLAEMQLLVFDADCGRVFGRLRGELMRVGINVDRMDLMIAAVAIVHDLTLVTHNTSDFQQIPGLRLVDWLAS